MTDIRNIILEELRTQLLSYENSVRTTYSSDLITDAITCGYVDPSTASAGSLEFCIRETFFRLSSTITGVQIDIEDCFV